MMVKTGPLGPVGTASMLSLPLILILILILTCFRCFSLTQAFAPNSKAGAPSLSLALLADSEFTVRSFTPAPSKNKEWDPTSSTNSSSNNGERQLRVAVVGAGPSGLLLTQRLMRMRMLMKQKVQIRVHVYERRSRPTAVLDKRAYALGIGIRGRTAIQSVERSSSTLSSLWSAVKRVGYPSERFILHFGPFSLKLRDEQSRQSRQSRQSTDCKTIEPSLLLYQSDLCRTLADALDNEATLSMHWDCGVREIDLQSMTLTTDTGTNNTFDLIVGCDGVNSVVRKAIDAAWPDFQTTQEVIPGLFKVVRLDVMPPLLDPTAVQLLVPKSGAVTAFVEPTANSTCCVLFAGRNATDSILTTYAKNSNSNSNITDSEANESATLRLARDLEARYPKLAGADLLKAAQQLIQYGAPAQASRVTCNTYHYFRLDSKTTTAAAAVLVGDAAHATGGVSGQGVNSALVDAALLADCLEENLCDDDDDNNNNIIDKKTFTASLYRALLTYSQHAVPEGKALYDLSFGPSPTTAWGKLRLAVASARDTIFQGRWGIGEKPIQTQLTTSLRSFADIRRDRDPYYEQTFPDQEDWDATLAALDATTSRAVTEKRNAEAIP